MSGFEREDAWNTWKDGDLIEVKIRGRWFLMEFRSLVRNPQTGAQWLDVVDLTRHWVRSIALTHPIRKAKRKRIVTASDESRKHAMKPPLRRQRSRRK